MSYLLVQPNVILKTLDLEADRLKKSSISRLKRCSYHMVIRWLTAYETNSTSSDPERSQGYLQAFLTLCDIGDFERAKALILMPIDDQKPLHEYFGKLGLYIEQCQLYEALLDKFDAQFNSFLLNSLGWAYGYLSKIKMSLSSHQDALEIAEISGDYILEINAYEGLGRIYTRHLENPKKGEYYYQKILEIAIKFGDIEKQILALIGQSDIQYISGKYNRSISLGHQALELSKSLNNNEDIILQIYLSLGYAYVQSRKYDLGIEILQKQLQKSRSLNEKRLEAEILTNIASCYSLQGTDDLALESFTESLNIANAINDTNGKRISLLNLAISYSSMGDFDKSIKNLNIVYSDLQLYDGRLREKNFCLSTLGYCYGCKKEFMLAMDYAQTALDVAKSIPNKELEGMAIAVMGNAYWQTGKSFQGIFYWSKSVVVYPPWKSSRAKFIFMMVLQKIGEKIKNMLLH